MKFIKWLFKWLFSFKKCWWCEQWHHGGGTILVTPYCREEVCDKCVARYGMIASGNYQ